MSEVTRQEAKLFSVLSSDRFLAMQGLNNEIPVYIYPFDATAALEVEDATKRLISRLATAGVPVLEINLLQLAVELLSKRGVLDAMIESEPTQRRSYLLEDLRAMLDPRDDLAPAIRMKLEETPAKVVILTGVGGVFPMVRSHTVLENVQDIARTVPVVLFFPGTYEQSSHLGSTLSLFGRLHDDRYYRARNLLDQEA